MKKLIITIAIALCTLNTDAQKMRHFVRDTIEILTYDSLGNEYHYCPPKLLIRKIEIGDEKYWKRKSNTRFYNRLSLGLFILGTLTIWIVPNLN